MRRQTERAAHKTTVITGRQERLTTRYLMWRCTGAGPTCDQAHMPSINVRCRRMRR